MDASMEQQFVQAMRCIAAMREANRSTAINVEHCFKAITDVHPLSSFGPIWPSVTSEPVRKMLLATSNFMTWTMISYVNLTANFFITIKSELPFGTRTTGAKLPNFSPG